MYQNSTLKFLVNTPFGELEVNQSIKAKKPLIDFSKISLFFEKNTERIFPILKY